MWAVRFGSGCMAKVPARNARSPFTCGKRVMRTLSGNHTSYRTPRIRGHVALRVGRIQVSLINLHAPFTVFAIPVVCEGSDWNLPHKERIAPAGNCGVDVGIESDWYLSLPERSPGTVSPHRKIQAFPDTALRAKPHYPIRPPTCPPEKVVKKCLFYVVNIFILKKI